MTERRISNPLALAVLALLSERPMHPYEIGFLMRTRGIEGSIKVNRGSLYTVVEALQREGLIEARETQREGRRPERTVYAITDSGSAEYASWHDELLTTPIKEYPLFAVGLSFLARLTSAEAAARLEERARLLEQEVEQARYVLEAVPAQYGVERVFMIENEYELEQRECELAWIRKIVQEIGDGALRFPRDTEAPNDGDPAANTADRDEGPAPDVPQPEG
jgi:DNA-binding PadR family transcriptional regulator